MTLKRRCFGAKGSRKVTNTPGRSQEGTRTLTQEEPQKVNLAIPWEDDRGNPLVMAWVLWDGPFGNPAGEPIDVDDVAGLVQQLQSTGHKNIRVEWIYDRPTGTRFERIVNKDE